MVLPIRLCSWALLAIFWNWGETVDRAAGDALRIRAKIEMGSK
jgi:hypothetical protein